MCAVNVSEVSRQYYIVAALFKAALGDVHEAQLVGLAQFLVALGNVCLDGDGRPSELRRESKALFVGKLFGGS